jgi:hypothetical protein
VLDFVVDSCLLLQDYSYDGAIVIPFSIRKRYPMTLRTLPDQQHCGDTKAGSCNDRPLIKFG